MKDKEKTQIILDVLIDYNTIMGKTASRVIFPELRLGSGFCGVAQRRIDLFVIDSSAGNNTTSYEIKVSRQDFKHDLDNDLKQRGARLYSNYFWYVTPIGLLKQEEIPLWAGLIEVDLDKKKIAQFKVPAPLHEKLTPTWGLICSMVRHVNKDCGLQRIAELEQQLKATQSKLTTAHNLLKRLAHNEQYMEWELKRYE